MTYKNEINTKAIEDLQGIMGRLPDFCKQFLNAKNYSLSARTRLGYARDLEIFLYFIKVHNPMYANLDIKEIPFNAVKALVTQDIDEYMAMLESYTFNGKKCHNSAAGKRRKLAAVRELYKYLCKCGYCKTNPASLTETPKDEEKKIIRALDNDEKRALYRQIKDTSALSDRQIAIHKTLEIRDLAIVTLFLGTGIRVSELVGLNLDDIDLKHQYIMVLAKGGKYTQHFFNEDVYRSLDNYLTYCRGNLKPSASEEALFLSRRGSRIGVRNVEMIIKNYSSSALGKDRAITPHKLRSTYGTDLYAATGDIALVSDNLGHADISTTKHYYAKQNIENLRKNKEFKIFTDEN